MKFSSQLQLVLVSRYIALHPVLQKNKLSFIWLFNEIIL
ncbi:MAG: hypothetical protein ANABAC_2997 [Anaerolineae bacterium]|nr:MAG: hypothetical protein ANABAC_2997 [Anaerolineae bacterium]